MTDNEMASGESNAIKRVTVWGALANLLLAAVKLITGSLIGSVALVADGVHSVTDLVTDAVVLLGNVLSRRPPDSSHPYGHGRFETFATLLISLSLVAVGVGIAYDAGSALYRREVSFPGVGVLLIALLSILIKEALFQVTKRVAVRTNSPSVLANAWHHRSDAFSSIAVLAGGVAGMFGWGHGDQIAGLIVGLMVGGAGVTIAFDAIKELSEHSLEEKELESLREALDSHAEVFEWHKLRSKKIGREAFIDCHILVDPAMSVEQAHRITEELEQELTGLLTLPAYFVFHVEPMTDEMCLKRPQDR